MSKTMHTISTLIWLLTVVSAGAQDVLKTDIKNFEARRKVAYGLCGNMKVLCGWVVAEGDSFADFNEVRIKGNNTLEDALKTITIKNPKYQWTIEDGVINIIPKNEFRHLVNGKDPLDTIVRNFKITDVIAEDAEYPLYKAAGLNCPAGGGSRLRPLREHYNRISLQLDNVTLRTALNRIIAKSGGTASWTFGYSSIQDGKPVIDIICWRPHGDFFPENPALKKENDQPAHQSYRNWLFLAVGILVFYLIVKVFLAKIKPHR